MSTKLETPTSRTVEQTGNSGRGRDADTPAQIPFKGWKDIGRRVFKEVSDDRVTLVSAGVTFYLLLALGPLLAAFVSIYGLAFDASDIARQVVALGGVLPGDAVDIVGDELNRLASAENSQLGIAFVTSLAIALWSVNAGMKALFEAMNVAYDETEKRGFIKLTLITLSFTVLTILSVIALIVFNALFSSFQGGAIFSLPERMVNLLTALIALMALILFMACLYRFGPSRESPQWLWITPGAIFAGVMIIIVSALFTYYVANFGTYNETYGSLGAVVGFLTWLWLVVIVLVVSAEINAEMEHQTARDTTIGPREPIGDRGAKMADELGKTHIS